MPLRPLPDQPAVVQCCTRCSTLVDSTSAFAERSVSLSDICASAESCQLCELIVRTLRRCRHEDKRNVDIVREDAALRVGRGGPRILRFCADPDQYLQLLLCAGQSPDLLAFLTIKPRMDPYSEIPIGFPVLPEPEDPARFRLLRAWLRWCDKSHDCNKHQGESETVLPTRVLYVGDPDAPGYEPDVLSLYCPKQNDSIQYVALSHCWGKSPPTKDSPRFCTTDDNIKARLERFSFSELPKTFQDAVRVTRELGIRFLWIDSLCIIQGNMEDWKREAVCMEGIFASAYCILAATSAVDSNAGFLDRDVSSEYMYIQNTSGKQFYICADMDNFENDVEKAQINMRAWVMQERVLARRTIHFSANQTYWECGEGVYCENLTRLRNPYRKEYFTLDPMFPSRLMESTTDFIVEFLGFLFEDYSKRGLTVKSDRCVAISGLEARIADALECESRYGILQKHLHRSLLWLASDNKMERIAYTTQHVPSWSWMAYHGGIRFMDAPYGTVSWVDTLCFDKECEFALVTDIGEFRDCTTQLNGKDYSVFDRSGVKRGWIQYDVEDGEELCKERCVVIGRVSRYDDNHSFLFMECYILVVRPTGVDGEYKRVGVGLIQINYIVRRRLNVRLV